MNYFLLRNLLWGSLYLNSTMLTQIIRHEIEMLWEGYFILLEFSQLSVIWQGGWGIGKHLAGVCWDIQMINITSHRRIIQCSVDRQGYDIISCCWGKSIIYSCFWSYEAMRIEAGIGDGETAARSTTCKQQHIQDPTSTCNIGILVSSLQAHTCRKLRCQTRYYRKVMISWVFVTQPLWVCSKGGKKD